MNNAHLLTPHQNVHVPIPGTCESVTFYSKRVFVDVVKNVELHFIGAF